MYDLNFVVHSQGKKIRVLLDTGQTESALIRFTRVIDVADRQLDASGLRCILFGMVPECFLGSPQIERRLRPRWRCVYGGQSVVVRARSAQEAQFEAAQVLMSLEAIQCGIVQDGRQIVPSYV